MSECSHTNPFPEYWDRGRWKCKKCQRFLDRDQVRALDCSGKDARIAELEAERDKYKRGCLAVHHLIEQSEGVYGLHLNGDVESWSGLLSGGRFEEWLSELPPMEECAPAPPKE